MEPRHCLIAKNIQVEVPLHRSILRREFEQNRVLLQEPKYQAGEHKKIHEGRKLLAGRVGESCRTQAR
jgi:hypothetical protein